MQPYYNYLLLFFVKDIRLIVFIKIFSHEINKADLMREIYSQELHQEQGIDSWFWNIKSYSFN